MYHGFIATITAVWFQWCRMEQWTAAIWTHVTSFLPGGGGLYANADCRITSHAAYKPWAYDDTYEAVWRGTDFSNLCTSRDWVSKQTADNQLILSSLLRSGSIYNRLSCSIRNSSSVNGFKTVLKTFSFCLLLISDCTLHFTFSLVHAPCFEYWFVWRHWIGHRVTAT